ncbi:MAG: prephenate dehydratase [Nitrosomonadaceae bacterium]|nr:prephenate dehydratase [Nitrosomonadaceae bacterium]|tara:strand:- start:5603 stop:6667 length:1065 start_codon:yes stop_codon:yes gene_type:complete
MTDQINTIRDEIDEIDSELLKLVNKRATLAKQIGQAKKEIIYRPDREAQVLLRLQKLNTGPLSPQHVIQIFTEIMSLCRSMERPMNVAYLGPQGTFSEEAVLNRFGKSVTAIPCESIDRVFHKVESGLASYGIVPVENSNEGAVGKTLDLLLQTSLKICGEVLLPIHQCLLSLNTDLNKIKKIYSHPQSLAQCHEWLNKNFALPHIKRVIAASNAHAAMIAADDKNAAAIASRKAADVYGLSVCAENIEDDPKNTTRFLVIGSQNVALSGKDKTSLAMSSKNRPGAIHELLSPLAKHGVSMTHLESRPSRSDQWEYVFFADIRGHQKDEEVTKALEEIRKRATFLKILGSYPSA